MAHEVNAATDALREALVSAEDALTKLQLGVSASVPLVATEPNGRTLRYQKHGPSPWRLMIFDTEGRACALVEASRADRIQAAARLDDLRKALFTAASAALADVRAAVGQVETFIRRISGCP